ncbi:glycoside hydrolase family 79 protein [Calocera cornea HHB12733]|uniref:Glycoside hydrolase family 79 protein n=1 Tax=Calocera cornea HHB12733 TaxID=1353952 RepID=A0A165FXF9_9BASI|nr:glycoside hydrolase family 79 protein [Calocera cornea HHB12733]
MATFLVSLAFSVLVFGEIILINVGQPMWAYAFNMFCVASKCVLPGRIILNLREAAMSLDGWDIPTFSIETLSSFLSFVAVTAIALIYNGQSMWANAFTMFYAASKAVLPGRIILNIREAAMSLDRWDIPTAAPSSHLRMPEYRAPVLGCTPAAPSPGPEPMRPFLLPLLGASLSLSASAATAQRAATAPIPIPLPSSVPPNAQLVPSFPVGMSIEQDRFPDWAGTLAAPNNYTRTVLANVVDRVGSPPPIRVGGTTEDRTWLSPNGSVRYAQALFPPSSNSSTQKLYPEATIVYTGADFYRSAANFPKGTEFTFGINLRARSPDMAAQVAQRVAQAASRDNVTVRALEIGNEPDMYGNWSMPFYAANWNAAASAIVNASLNASSPFPKPTFQLFAYANPNPAANFTVAGALAAGVAQGEGVKGLAKVASLHHYNGNPAKVSDLMRKSSVSSQVGQFTGEIAAAQRAGLQFEFGETGSIGGHGAPGVSNVAGSVIWAVDYVFQALAIGIKRVYFHNGVCYRYNMFQPIGGCADGSPPALSPRPHIMPMYHVLLVLAEAVAYKAPVKVAELQVASGDVSAYGVWAADTGALLRVVIVNSAAYYVDASTTTTPRGSYCYELSNLPSPANSTNSTTAASTPFVRRLSLPGVERPSGLTWAGQSFEGPSGKAEGTRVDEPLAPDGSVQGWESEVVVVYFRER